MYIGIDGCKKGWILAIIDDNLNLSHKVESSLDCLRDLKASQILIDMPIGFPIDAYRQCEVEARSLLMYPRMNSVFFTPHKDAVDARNEILAKEINQKKLGKSISRQSWCICPKINDVNMFVESNKKLKIKESHPELCFYIENKGVSMAHKKSLPAGIEERKKIISQFSLKYLQVIDKTFESNPRKEVKMDDILDATIMAIRASQNNLQRVPATKSRADSSVIFY